MMTSNSGIQLKTALSFAVVLFTMIAVSSCSTENPVNVLPDEVSGTYGFTRYEFVPSATAVQPANVLDTLVTANTFLRLTDGGQFLLNYQFINGPESIISGNFNVSANRVDLLPAPGSEARLAALLLEAPVRLERSPLPGVNPDPLILNNTQTVDLSSFSGRYAGLPAVQGVLTIRLTPRN